MISTEKALTQWDLDRVVEISTTEAYNEVHFYNKNSVEAMVVYPNEEKTKANIPNLLLQEKEQIIVWLVYANENGERSIEVETLHVTPKKKPADYVYTETEVITFKRLVEGVNKAVENANAISKDLEEKRDSGYFNGKDGKDGKDGYTPQKGVDYLTEADIALAKLLAKDVVKDYVADELKGPQSEIEEIRSEIVEIRDAVASLENMIVPCDPFDLEFGTAEELVLDSTGKYYYMSADTYGDNWRVSGETTATTATESTVGHIRMFSSEDMNYRFFRAMSAGKDYVFEFDAPISRYYKLTANVVLADSGGYADIYVNDVKVGRIDTYNEEQKLETFSMGAVRLNVGKFANKIKIVPNGISGGTKCRPSFVGFSFTAPNE